MICWGWVQRGPPWHVGQAAMPDRHTASQPVPRSLWCPGCDRAISFDALGWGKSSAEARSLDFTYFNCCAC